MTKLKNFWIKKDRQTKNYGRFLISPLPGGFGHTIGNSLRRVLLGAIPGAAITQIKVTGADHPFASLTGVKEDLIDIIMNVKQINIAYDKDKPVKGKLEKSGPGPVTAGDIKFAPGVKVVNPDLVLANVANKKTKLKIEFTVEKGEGYSLAEDHKTDKRKLISIDAIFSPVVKANFAVSPVRVGKKSDYDRIAFEIWTNGTIKPDKLLKQAGEILVDAFSQVAKPKTKKPSKKLVVETNHDLDLLIDELDLPLRLVNALKRAGYNKVADFSGVKREKIIKTKNVGDKSLVQLEEVLAKKGVVLEE